MLAVLVKVLLDEHGADGVAQVTIHVGHAEFPTRGSLLSTEQDPGGFCVDKGLSFLQLVAQLPVEFLLHSLEPGVEVVKSVADESPQDVVGQHPGKLHRFPLVWRICFPSACPILRPQQTSF